MAGDPRNRQAGYTLERATEDAFGRAPLWPWSAIVAIMLGGVAGGALSPGLQSVDGSAHPALRWAACAGYGIVAGATLTVLPLAGRLAARRTSLAKRPATAEGFEPNWWPLRLLAAALRGTPDATRRTQRDFSEAIDRARPAVRGLLVYRLWPACVAAFVTPVLGLLSAWEAGKQIDVILGQDAGDVLMRFVSQVSPPMVATIAAALGLMVVLAIIDQSVKGLLRRWGTTVQLADGKLPAVRELLQESVISEPASVDRPVSEGEPPAAGLELPAVGPSADDLEKLAEVFSTRGKGS